MDELLPPQKIDSKYSERQKEKLWELLTSELNSVLLEYGVATPKDYWKSKRLKVDEEPLETILSELRRFLTLSGDFAPRYVELIVEKVKTKFQDPAFTRKVNNLISRREFLRIAAKATAAAAVMGSGLPEKLKSFENGAWAIPSNVYTTQANPNRTLTEITSELTDNRFKFYFAGSNQPATSEISAIIDTLNGAITKFLDSYGDAVFSRLNEMSPTPEYIPIVIVDDELPDGSKDAAVTNSAIPIWETSASGEAYDLCAIRINLSTLHGLSEATSDMDSIENETPIWEELSHFHHRLLLRKGLLEGEVPNYLGNWIREMTAQIENVLAVSQLYSQELSQRHYGYNAEALAIGFSEDPSERSGNTSYVIVEDGSLLYVTHDLIDPYAMGTLMATYLVENISMQGFLDARNDFFSTLCEAEQTDSIFQEIETLGISQVFWNHIVGYIPLSLQVGLWDLFIQAFRDGLLQQNAGNFDTWEAIYARRTTTTDPLVFTNQSRINLELNAAEFRTLGYVNAGLTGGAFVFPLTERTMITCELPVKLLDLTSGGVLQVDANTPTLLDPASYALFVQPTAETTTRVVLERENPMEVHWQQIPSDVRTEITTNLSPEEFNLLARPEILGSGVFVLEYGEQDNIPFVATAQTATITSTVGYYAGYEYSGKVIAAANGKKYVVFIAAVYPAMQYTLAAAGSEYPQPDNYYIWEELPQLELADDRATSALESAISSDENFIKYARIRQNLWYDTQNNRVSRDTVGNIVFFEGQTDLGINIFPSAFVETGSFSDNSGQMIYSNLLIHYDAERDLTILINNFQPQALENHLQERGLSYRIVDSTDPLSQPLRAEFDTRTASFEADNTDKTRYFLNGIALYAGINSGEFNIATVDDRTRDLVTQIIASICNMLYPEGYFDSEKVRQLALLFDLTPEQMNKSNILKVALCIILSGQQLEIILAGPSNLKTFEDPEVISTYGAFVEAGIMNFLLGFDYELNSVPE